MRPPAAMPRPAPWQARPTSRRHRSLALCPPDCGRTGSPSDRERLEFDHIVPFSKGRPNTVRNIELRWPTPWSQIRLAAPFAEPGRRRTGPSGLARRLLSRCSELLTVPRARSRSLQILSDHGANASHRSAATPALSSWCLPAARTTSGSVPLEFSKKSFARPTSAKTTPRRRRLQNFRLRRSGVDPCDRQSYHQGSRASNG
jgi:HNH endonuclease